MDLCKNFSILYYYYINYNISNSFYYLYFVISCCRILIIRILFFIKNPQIKEDKIGEHDLIFSTRSKERDNHQIFIIIYFLSIISNVLTKILLFSFISSKIGFSKLIKLYLFS
ncbi:hypothetical protein EXW43_28520 (plasmid) [Bacillus mycoides]|nr:hypothetical protein EXW43_28520 [Bacillus mycoides]